MEEVEEEEREDDGGKKRGRPKSWVQANTHQDGNNLVCDVAIWRVVDGKRVSLPCGKSYLYISKKGVAATTGMRNHLVSAHPFSEDGTPPS